MTDVPAVVDRYIAIWNETDGARRRELIARTWREDASYRDPMLSADGAGEVDAMVAGVQQKFPTLRFRLTGAVDGHHDRLRFAWELADPQGGEPAVVGVDFAELAADGRLRAVTGFFDRVAAQ